LLDLEYLWCFSGKGWVGWKNDSRNATDPLEITFNFDSVREFNAVSIHISNQFTKEVQVSVFIRTEKLLKVHKEMGSLLK